MKNLKAPEYKVNSVPKPRHMEFTCTMEVFDDVGGHKMHIFTANVPTFHSRYRRYVLITNEFHEFC
jgi:hypothetical protein